MTRPWLAMTLCLSLGAACSKREEQRPRRTEPWLANPSASVQATSSAPMTFHFSSESQVRFALPGRKARPQGRVALLEGTLRLDPRDLTHTTARLDFDLLKLSIDEDSLPDELELATSSPTALALQWLELGPEVPRERREQFSRARFELVSLEALSPASIDLDTPGPRGQTRATAVGTLLVHGFRAPVRVEVLVQSMKVEPPAPRRLSIRSAAPLVLALAPHEIVARGPSGIADPLQTLRAADWVGKTARIEFELVAEADSAAAK